jgi:hypothetical protein
MPYLADRCQDTSSSIGNGVLVLRNVCPTGYQTFLQAYGANRAVVSYSIFDAALSSNWETGYGVFDGTRLTLSRDDLTASSNANQYVNFTSGSLIILNTLTQDLAKNSLYGTQSALQRGWAMP